MTNATKKLFILLAAFCASLLLLRTEVQGMVEIEPYIGFTTSSEFDQTARQIESLEIRGGFTRGVPFGYFFTPNLGVEASWARQQTRLGLTAGGARARFFDMPLGQLSGNFFARRESWRSQTVRCNL